MSTREKRGDWVTLGPEPFLATCQRCGRQEEKPPMPIAIDLFVAWTNVIVKRHAGCPKPPKDAA